MNFSALLLCLLLAASAGAQDPGAAVYVKAEADPAFAARVEKSRTQLQGLGYYFHAPSGTIISPATKTALSFAQVEKLVLWAETRDRRYAVQAVAALLENQDPAQPLSPDLARRLSTILSGAPDDSALLEALERARIGPSAELKGASWNAYVESVRLWDGGETNVSLIKRAIPVKAQGSALRQPAYFDAAERRLSELMKADVERHLETYAVGRELLANFRRDGKIELPAIRILPLRETSGAQYRTGWMTIVINHQRVLSGVLARLPRKDAARLAQALADPARLADYLSNDASARRAFVADNDETLIHELAHAWQDRRGPFWTEMRRGNVPNVDPLECEHEAFLYSGRLLHEKLGRDPQAALKSSGLNDYAQMLADFDGWRASIDRRYHASEPATAMRLAEVRQVQEIRRRAALQLGEDNWRAWLKQRLYRAARERGTEAVAAEQRMYATIFTRFLGDEYPAMQVEGLLRLARAYASAGRRDQALAAANAAVAAAARLGSGKLAEARELAASIGATPRPAPVMLRKFR